MLLLKLYIGKMPDSIFMRQDLHYRPVECSSFARSQFYNYLCISMPTVLLINGYRFFFFSNERNEPIHIHIEKAEKYAKFWIEPVFVSINYGFTSKELREISEIIDKNEILIRDKWNEHFNK